MAGIKRTAKTAGRVLRVFIVDGVGGKKSRAAAQAGLSRVRCRRDPGTRARLRVRSCGGFVEFGLGAFFAIGEFIAFIAFIASTTFIA